MHNFCIKKYPKTPVSYKKYIDIFTHSYKSSFGKPQVDICRACEEFYSKLKNKFFNPISKKIVITKQFVYKRCTRKFYTVVKADRNIQNR